MDVFPGSKWWKVDFHAHTPASVCYGKDHPDEKILKEYPLKEWLLDYMKAGIDCVAVTDHNTGTSVDSIKSAYEDLSERKPAGFRELTIFPGVEISTVTGVHILGIFPEDTTSKDIHTVISNCKYNGEEGSGDGCTKETTEEVINLIAARGGLAIPAHVEGPQGLFHDMKGAPLDTVLDNDKVIAMESTQWCLPPEQYRT